MKKSEILKLCKNYYIASGDAERIADKEAGKLVLPALVEYDNRHVTYVRSEDNGRVNVSFFGKDGYNLCSVSSRYAACDYIYVREAYWKDSGKVRYFADFVPGNEFLKNKVMPARYMPKSVARTFLKIKSVGLRKLKFFSMSEIHGMGYKSPELFFKEFDAKLSEREAEFCSSEMNPFVFVYEYEKAEYDD